MRIVIYSQYYPPEVGALATRMSSIARLLKAMGHQVTVVSETPNYPTGIVEKKYKGKCWTVEKVDGIDVVRTFVFANPRKTNVQRMLFYLSYMTSSIIKGFSLPCYDVLIATSPPLFVGVAGLIVSRLVNARFVLDIRDLWPESAFFLGEMKKGAFYRLAEWLERLLYRKADMITVAVPGFRQRLQDKGVDVSKIIAMPNGVDLSFFSPRGKNIDFIQKYGISDRFVVLFSGNHGLAQGLDSVLRAAMLLKEQRNITFLFIGSGVEKDKLIKMAAEHQLDNVIFDSEQPYASMPDIISVADACLVPLKDLSLFNNALPSKMFEYMACGKPIVSTLMGEGRTVIENGNCGVCVQPENAEELANAILELYNNPDRVAAFQSSAHDFVRKNYSRRQIVENFDEQMKARCSKK